MRGSAGAWQGEERALPHRHEPPAPSWGARGAVLGGNTPHFSPCRCWGGRSSMPCGSRLEALTLQAPGKPPLFW